MKTERDLFEEWFPLKHLFNYLYWSEEQKNYVYNQYDEEHCKAYEYVNSSWSAWCASASREGYKLVPVQPELETMQNMSQALRDNAGETPKRKMQEVYKAAIGVVE